MRKQLTILALAVVLTGNMILSGERWYFGYDSSDNIVAFNADGDTHLILEDAGDRDFSHHSLGQASALFRVTRDHQTEGLYYLTSETALALEGDVDLTLLDAAGFDILAYEHPYLVIKPNGCRSYCEWSMSVWLANLDTGHLEEIAPYVFIGKPQPLGMDSQYLRYAARSAPDVPRWELFERNLATGEVRQFYRFSNSYPSSLRASLTGEYWFYGYPTVVTSGERPEFFSLLIRADNSVETLAHTPENGTREYGWDMVGNDLMKWPLQCETNCWLELQPVEGGAAQRFTLPEPEYAEVVRRITESRILVEQDEVFWLLNVSGENLRLGMNRPGFGSLLSPDGQWLFTVDNNEAHPTPFSLWNLHRQEIALQGLIDDGFSLDFFEHGILISEFPLGEGHIPSYAKRSQNLPPDTLYRFSDSAVFELPSDIFYFDVLADGDIMGSRHRDGIYRVNPATGEESLLLDGVQALYLRPLEY